MFFIILLKKHLLELSPFVNVCHKNIQTDSNSWVCESFWLIQKSHLFVSQVIFYI